MIFFFNPRKFLLPRNKWFFTETTNGVLIRGSPFDECFKSLLEIRKCPWLHQQKLSIVTSLNFDQRLAYSKKRFEVKRIVELFIYTSYDRWDLHSEWNGVVAIIKFFVGNRCFFEPKSLRSSLGTCSRNGYWIEKGTNNLSAYRLFSSSRSCNPRLRIHRCDT